jgi:glycosyltransferase involved in cell wall biosynthesis
VLLDAYAELARRGRQVPRLVVAGRATPEAHGWLERLSRTPLSGHITYRGYVADTDRESLYAGARALLLPSLDEGFGLPVLEAMSAGVPVVTSNRGSLPEVVGTAGVLLDAEDVGAWSSAIERLGSDTAWLNDLSRAGLERAGTFTWARAAGTLHAAYADAVRRRGQR